MSVDRSYAARGWEWARTHFPMTACEECGAPGKDRHHIDGDPRNNDSANVQWLCR
jgi:hypothetical protein